MYQLKQNIASVENHPYFMKVFLFFVFVVSFPSPVLLVESFFYSLYFVKEDICCRWSACLTIFAFLAKNSRSAPGILIVEASPRYRVLCCSGVRRSNKRMNKNESDYFMTIKGVNIDNELQGGFLISSWFFTDAILVLVEQSPSPPQKLCILVDEIKFWKTNLDLNRHKLVTNGVLFAMEGLQTPMSEI